MAKAAVLPISDPATKPALKKARVPKLPKAQQEPAFQGQFLTGKDFEIAKLQNRLSYRLSQIEHLLEEINRLRFAAKDYMDYVDLHLAPGDVPSWEAYMRKKSRLKGALR